MQMNELTAKALSACLYQTTVGTDIHFFFYTFFRITLSNSFKSVKRHRFFFFFPHLFFSDTFSLSGRSYCTSCILKNIVLYDIGHKFYFELSLFSIVLKDKIVDRSMMINDKNHSFWKLSIVREYSQENANQISINEENDIDKQSNISDFDIIESVDDINELDNGI